jgi:O-antigen/teichoic acid export membrane protein
MAVSPGAKRSSLLNPMAIGASVGIVGVFTIAQRVLQTARGIVFARVLGPEAYGIYTLAFFFIPLAAMLAKFGIPSACGRFVPRYHANRNTAQFFLRAAVIVGTAGLVVTTTIALGSEQISTTLFGSSLLRRTVLFCAASVLPLALFELVRGTFQGLRLFGVSSLMDFSLFLLFTSVAVGFVLRWDAPNVILGTHAAALVLVTLGGYLFLSRYLRKAEPDPSATVEPGFYGRLLRYSAWFVIAPVVDILFSYTDRWMLSRLTTLADVGVYSVASAIAGPLFLFGGIAGRIMLPSLSSEWEAGRQREAMARLNSAIRLNAVALLFVAMSVTVLRRPIILTLYGQEYQAAVAAVGFLMCFQLAHSLLWTLGTYPLLLERTHVPLLCNIVGLAANVGLNVLLIPRFGITGAAIATASAFVVSLLTMMMWATRTGFTLERSTTLAMLLALALTLPDIGLVAAGVAAGALLLFTEIILPRGDKQAAARFLGGSLTRVFGGGR